MEQLAQIDSPSVFNRAITIDRIDLYPLRASGGVSPSMALGVMQTRPGLLVAIVDTHGCTGWGEVWANFPPRANLHKAHLIEDVLSPKLAKFSYTEPREVEQFLRDSLGVYFLHIGQERVFEHILAGLDVALWDLALRSAGRSFAAHVQTPAKARCYASSINRDELDNGISEHAAMGQAHFKLKLGFGDEGDLAFVERAARLCPEGAALMVDSNQSWSVSKAKSMLSMLEEFDLLFAEEPIAANAPLSAWEHLATSSSIALAAGENVYGLENFRSMADAGVGVLQPDVAKWGGITGALELARSLPSDVELWPHFMGTAVGQMAALSVTAAVGNRSVCEIDVNANPLRTELCGDALSICGGSVPLPSVSGLVLPPDPNVLASVTES